MKGTIKVWKALFVLLAGAGLFVALVRFGQGLEAATNLSDAFPWGLWIGFDVLVGVGLAAGGFVIAATVHVFHMEKYESIARPPVLTAFLGYLLVCVALLFDLGRPYRIWHPLVMWNPHSVMFEVAWCVMLYTTVLALEFSPLVFERFNLQKPLKVMAGGLRAARDRGRAAADSPPVLPANPVRHRPRQAPRAVVQPAAAGLLLHQRDRRRSRHDGLRVLHELARLRQAPGGKPAPGAGAGRPS